MERKEWPPRVLIALPLPGDLQPTPWVVTTRYPILPCRPHTVDQYLSVAESDALIREARAAAFEEAAVQVDLMKLTPIGRINLIERFRLWAKVDREPLSTKSKTEGEE